MIFFVIIINKSFDKLMMNTSNRVDKMFHYVLKSELHVVCSSLTHQLENLCFKSTPKDTLKKFFCGNIIYTPKDVFQCFACGLDSGVISSNPKCRLLDCAKIFKNYFFLCSLTHFYESICRFECIIPLHILIVFFLL